MSGEAAVKEAQGMQDTRGARDVPDVREPECLPGVTAAGWARDDHDGPTLFAVGVGPGDPDLLTLKAARTLAACPVIAAVRTGGGATTALDIARQAVPGALAEKRIVEVGFAMTRDPDVLAESHRAAAESICVELAAGRDVAMPILGDPSIYSTFHHIKPLVEAAGFATQVIPGVPSFCAVAATLGANLTPAMEAPLHVLPTGYVDVRGALDLPGTKVFMKAGRSLGELTDALRAAGMLERAGLVQDCGLPTQVVVHDLAGWDPPQRGGYFTTAVVR